ncbi:MAG: hypothetical protein JWO03_1743 [Bacteroidetes bacterium]|nr:hypothetical protein [Bacteroidota bacterium]
MRTSSLAYTLYFTDKAYIMPDPTKPNPISAYIGIGAAIGMAISDMILLGVPRAGWEGDLSSFSLLSQVSMWRIQIGTLMGWICSFFICFGFWYMKQMMAHPHPRLALIMFTSLSSYMIFGGAFHAGYYFAGAAWHAGDMALYDACIAQLKIMSYVSAVGLVIGTSLYIYMLAFTPNHFPKWLKFINLLVLQGLCLGLFSILPAPVGGFLKPTFINVATVIFFCFQLWVMKTKNPETRPGIS